MASSYRTIPPIQNIQREEAKQIDLTNQIDGTKTIFTLSETIPEDRLILISYNGQILHSPANFTLINQTEVQLEAAPNLDDILIVYSI